MGVRSRLVPGTGQSQAAARAGWEVGTLSLLFPCQGRAIRSGFCRRPSLACLPCLPGDRVRSMPAPSPPLPPSPPRAGRGRRRRAPGRVLRAAHPPVRNRKIQ